MEKKEPIGLKGSKYIPIYGMFTKDINEIPTYDDWGLIMVFYHGIIFVSIILGVIWLIIK